MAQLAGASPTATHPPSPPPLSVYLSVEDNPASHSYEVFALNATDGKVRWHLSALGPVFYPSLRVEGTLYLGANDGKVLALRASDGKLLWSYEVGGPLQAPLVIVNNTLYLATSNTIVALNRADGMLLWHTPVAPEDNIRRMLVVDGLIYLSSDDPTVDASRMTILNASDGSVHWRYQATQGTLDILEVAGNSVYVEEALQLNYGGVAKNIIHVLNASDGTLRWHMQLADDQVGQWFQANETIYLDASSGTLYVLDASNGTLQPVQSGPNNSPVTLAYVMMVSNGVLYGNSFPDAGLVAFNTSDWSLKWRYPTSESLGITAVIDGIVDGEIYDPTGANNAVYALKEGGTSLLWCYDAGKTFPALAVG